MHITNDLVIDCVDMNSLCASLNQTRQNIIAIQKSVTHIHTRAAVMIRPTPVLITIGGPERSPRYGC